MDGCKPVTTPAESSDTPSESSPLLGDADHSTYRRVVGKAMYGCSRPPGPELRGQGVGAEARRSD
eukprot:12485693-Heterocapsa_arctica.AAC.1